MMNEITRIFASPEYTPMWSSIRSVANIIAVIIAFVGIIYSMMALRKSLQTSHYAELDKMYFNLLKITLEKPYLNNPRTLDTDEQKRYYDIYAFMVWNFLETIYDRCRPGKQLPKISKLRATWYPIIDTENRLHREWFDNPDNKHKFKDSFHEFIRSDGFKRH